MYVCSPPPSHRPPRVKTSLLCSICHCGRIHDAKLSNVNISENKIKEHFMKRFWEWSERLGTYKNVLKIQEIKEGAPSAPPLNPPMFWNWKTKAACWAMKRAYVSEGLDHEVIHLGLLWLQIKTVYKLSLSKCAHAIYKLGGTINNNNYNCLRKFLKTAYYFLVSG